MATGASAVVIADAPDNCIVEGVLAKTIREHTNMRDYS